MKSQTNDKLFTKSAFKQALACPTSLYYYGDNAHYANQNNEDDFLQALAEGGQQVGDLAKVYYKIEEDCNIKELDYESSLAKTAKLFKRENIIIAEAAFKWENCFVRADIIEKRGQQINLVEVKAHSWNPEEDQFMMKRKGCKNNIYAGLVPYLYDVAFQKYVIQKALGETYNVTGYLMMTDKTKIAPVDGMNPMFKVVKDDNGRASIVRNPEAESLERVEHILTAFPVDNLCDKIIAGETSEQTELMGGKKFVDFVSEMSQLYVDHKRFYTSVGKKCLTCPFFSNEKTPEMLDGKRECWKEMAGFTEEDFEKPSVAELWGGGAGPRSIRGDLIDNKIFFLTGVRPDALPESKKQQESGLVPSERRLLQLALRTNNGEMLTPFTPNVHDGVYLDIPGLMKEMKKWRPPYHMIDFETTAVPIPFYKGMHPYEQVAFQFSHHIIEEDGKIRHAGQFLNTQKLHFPNYEFVRELKRQLSSDEGTIFRYASHENSILRAIRKQLINSSEDDKDELISFIDTITHSSKKEKLNHIGERDMVDLLEEIKKYYYHPDMRGSNSIKVVLPAILNSSKSIRQKYEKPIYGSEIVSCNIHRPEDAISWITIGPDGKVENPYKHLDEIASFLGVTTSDLQAFDDAAAEESAESIDGTIANGGAALAAYTKLQFSDSRWTDAIAKALYRYCELDTMSMVFIWEYFHEMTTSNVNN